MNIEGICGIKVHDELCLKRVFHIYKSLKYLIKVARNKNDQLQKNRNRIE